MNISKNLLSNKTFILYRRSIVTKLIIVIINVLNSVLINRYLGVVLRGEYTTIINTANLLQLILNLGIGSVYPAAKRKNVINVKVIFSTIIFFQSLVYLIFSVVIFTLGEIDFKYILIITLVSIVESQVTFMAIVEDVLVRNKIQIITTFLNTILLLFIFFFTKHNLNTLMIIIIFNHIVLTFVIVLRFKFYSISYSLLSKQMIKDVIHLGIPSMLMNLLMFCNYHLDVLILNWMTNDYYAIGLYGTAVTLGNMLWIVPDAFKDILFNRSSKKDNVEEIVVSIIINILICLVIIGGFVFVGKQFLIFMYGTEYADAYSLVLILFVGTLPMVLYKLIHPIYISNGKPKVVVKILLLSVIINIIGNIITIPIWGAVSCAVSSVFSYSICGIIFLIIFKKDFDFDFIRIIKRMI